ncbi:MAG TPA: hypothetical protein ENI76_02020 [Ignavibacteria bacterium]|nr:hypothetical protein [Ignavibacteria bacterium]
MKFKLSFQGRHLVSPYLCELGTMDVENIKNVLKAPDLDIRLIKHLNNVRHDDYVNVDLSLRQAENYRCFDHQSSYNVEVEYDGLKIHDKYIKAIVECRCNKQDKAINKVELIIEPDGDRIMDKWVDTGCPATLKLDPRESEVSYAGVVNNMSVLEIIED